MNEEQINAAREAFTRDPETACQALLGCSAEEMFITALRGCNQHKHKPGCPDYDGRAESDAKRLSELEKELQKASEEKARAAANRKGKNGKEAYHAAVLKDNKLRREANELKERQRTREAIAKSDDPDKAALNFLDAEKTKLHRKLTDAVSSMQALDKFMWEAQSKGGMSKEDALKTYGASLKKASEEVNALDAQFKDMVARWEEQSRKLGSKK